MPKYRGHLIDHVVDTLGCEREFAEDAVHAVERGVTELTAGDEQLILKGFGTFSLRHRRPSTTLNPRTRERIAVPASTRLGFKSRFEDGPGTNRSEEHTSELQSLMRISYAVFCLKKKTK